MGMKAEFGCGRRIGVEVVEKHEWLDQFIDVARTDQSGNASMRVSTRAQSNLPGNLFSAVRTREHCIGLHFHSPEVGHLLASNLGFESWLRSSALDPVKQGNEFIAAQ